MKLKKIICCLGIFALAICAFAKTKKKTEPAPEPAPQPVKELTIVDNLAVLSGKLVQDGNGGKPTFAFLALTSDDGNALVENYVTDALTEAMFNTGKIKIVERASIEKILSEQQFQDSALVNENTASEIGNLTGANYVCYGTVKDLGTQITLNVKVVEVSTAELCAMGRETVSKDTYLQNVGFEARKSGSGTRKSGGASSSAKTAKHVENNMWENYKFRNDFDEYDQYTFLLKGSEGGTITVGLRMAKNWIKSKAIVLTPRNPGESYLELKTSDGTIMNVRTQKAMQWNYLESGKVEGEYEEYKSTKWFFDILLNNELLTVRYKSGKIERFMSAGLEEKIIEAGLTVDDFYKAFSNEDF